MWRRERETTTITWWPQLGQRPDPDPAEPLTDWLCPCGAENWPRRTHCFMCERPKDDLDDQNADAQKANTIDPAKNPDNKAQDQNPPSTNAAGSNA